MNTTPGTRPAVTGQRRPSSALPTIEALGLQLADIERADDAADCRNTTEQRQHARYGEMAILEVQANALRDLITTMPGVSLADTAVPAVVAGGFAAALHVCETPNHQFERHSGIAERCLSSILAVIAAAAGFDAAVMNFADAQEAVA